MTDNDIIKALECCKSVVGGNCDACPYVCCNMYGDSDAIKDAIALINRQKAKIERLNEYISRCKSGEEYWVKCLLERPNEAIKEFAEKFKEKAGKLDLVSSGALIQRDYTISEVALNNLVTEMAGDPK